MGVWFSKHFTELAFYTNFYCNFILQISPNITLKPKKKYSERWPGFCLPQCRRLLFDLSCIIPEIQSGLPGKLTDREPRYTWGHKELDKMHCASSKVRKKNQMPTAIFFKAWQYSHDSILTILVERERPRILKNKRFLRENQIPLRCSNPPTAMFRSTQSESGELIA